MQKKRAEMDKTATVRSTGNGVVAPLGELVELRRDASKLGHPPANGARHAVAGPYLSAFRGGGIEFDEVRAYQPGDDVRCIDWRVTARTGRPHSRVFREERERPLWLGVDQGPGMHFGTRRAFKSVVAARAAALIAWSAREHSDRVGAVIRSTTQTHAHSPTRTDSGFFGLLSSLALATEEHEGHTTERFDETIARLASRAQSGCRTYLFSDFAELGESGKQGIVELARRTDLTCLGIYDPLEASPPPPGEYRVSNGREICSVSTGSRTFEAHWCQAFSDRWSALTDFCRSHRVGLIALRTDENLLDALTPLDRGLHRHGKRRAA